jgi:hypothetical protein
MAAINPPSVDILNFSNAIVYHESGAATELYKLWQRKTTVFVFLRHFACIACRAHATQVWGRKNDFEAKNTQLIFVGNGSPDFVNKFKEDMNLTGAAIFTDPTLGVFQSAGFRKGFIAALGPQSIINGVKLLGEGYKQGIPSKEAGSIWQLGGTVAVRQDGKILYQYIEEAMGDFSPETDEAALNAAAG